ncbi:uncharacterized protein JCM15063_003100 [Sporobolomyces koalae]|uniref:uncharacterized protein n=1 Tax=Sporobolomyces koalae TaxID=500713 RepID=UPI003180501F
MRSTIAIASLLSLSTFAVAQNYGRFPCTIVNGDGTFSPDQSQCGSDFLVAPGTGDGGSQGDNPVPTSPQCTQDAATGRYYCGIAGAACTSSDNCDNGQCTNGVCGGAPGTPCDGDDSVCSGFLYCTGSELQTTSSDTCGGIGSYCQDTTQSDPSAPASQQFATFNNFCASGYCNYGTAQCDVRGTTVGADCSSDPDFYCGQTSTGQALTCDQSTNQCALAAVPSGRARARRNVSLNTCAQGHEACAVEGTSSFECVDTLSSLEQCGGCAASGKGVDCTALPGVSSVGCSQGVCQIWSCLDGYSWDAESQSCVA